MSSKLFLLVILHCSAAYNVRPSLYDPIELVRFKLMDDKPSNEDDMDRNRYEMSSSSSTGSLPLLSRGERDTGNSMVIQRFCYAGIHLDNSSKCIEAYYIQAKKIREICGGKSVK